ncbi:MAG: endonuclease/exonuclease/phosphatase family protein [Bacteroidales bacterium]|jgi:exonuclease III|nr:endonuclease/exonuclease/phosphatase family protein [Bacteroidales bacterium]
MKHYKSILGTLLVLFVTLTSTNAQQKKQYQISCVGFYNLENLFDTLDTPNVRDTEFTPNGPKSWSGKRYNEKLNNMASVIARMGEEYIKTGPAILGVCEVENKSVLEDLIKTDQLKGMDYGIVHYNSPDKRGIDVGFLYQKDKFTPTSSKSYTLTVPGMDNFYTRDQLLVSGDFHGERIHVIVNHWPSRRGGEKRSRHLRNAAADLSKEIIDSIQNSEPKAKIILMGDLNDDPTNHSVKRHIGAKMRKDKLGEKDMYNPMEKIYKNGIGTTAYRDNWSLFDQLILSSSMVNKDYSDWTYYKTKIFSRKFLKRQEGRWKGYPYRTFVGNTYQGGYSDHFPVYVFLIKEK